MAPMAFYLLSELWEKYEEEHQAAESWGRQTGTSYKQAFDYVVAVLGDVRANDVTHEDLLKVRSVIQKMPKNRNKDAKFRDKSVKQILKMKVHERLSLTRINYLLGRISGFFKWAEDHHYVERNPGKKLRLPTKKKRTARGERKAFDHADLQRLVNALATQIQKPAKYPERKWVPLIAMYSGMRINEICQLTVTDVREVDGVLCFDANGKGEKRLKNATAKRLVPVHDALVELGLLDYLKGRRGQLWPNLKKDRDGHSRRVSRWFSSFKREHVTDDAAKTFHSLRHSFITQLHNADVAHTAISQLVGHAEGGQTLGRYSKGLKPANLKAALAKLDYGLELKALKQ